MTKHKPDHDPDHDPDHANDNGAGKSPAASDSEARSLPCADGAGGDAQRRSTPRPSSAVQDMPMLQFKSATSGGIWVFGQRRTIVEDDSRGRSTRRRSSGARSASATATRCSANSSCPISQPMPDVTELPDKGFPWQQQMGGQPEVHLDGTDAGTEVDVQDQRPSAASRPSPADRGGARPAQRRPARRQGRRRSCSRKGLLPASAVREDLDAVLTIVDWMSLDGPAPAPASPPPSPPPPTEQPRRRRVG